MMGKNAPGAAAVRLFIVLSFFSWAGAASGFEISKGAALRQNALVFRWPSNMERVFAGGRNFGISETRVRLWSKLYLDGVRVQAALESRAGFISSGDAASFGFRPDGSILGNCRPLERWDLTKNHVEESGLSALTRIDRFDVGFGLGAFDIDVGRQPLSMGTSRFVGVLDVVAPFAPGDLDATYKPGVDAVRIRKGIGMTGEAEIIAVGSKEWEDGALLGRFRSSFGNIDLEFVGGRFRRRTFGGFGWEGGSDPFGLWGEAALFERRKAHEKVRGGWSKAAFSCVAGVDYYVTADFVIGGALMHQDFGVRRPGDLVDAGRDAPFREGWVFLRSSSYALLTLSRELHPLVRFDSAGLVNLVDRSTLWQPRITVSTGENTDLSLYGWIATGKKSGWDGPMYRMKSEFGAMPDGAGLYARWFF